jgi:hypothetical protein
MQAAHHHHKFQIVVVDGGTQEKCHLSSSGLAVPLAQNFRISKACSWDPNPTNSCFILLATILT